MSNSDTELVDAVNKFISSYHKKIDKKDFLDAIKTIYSNKKQSKKDKTDSDKPKRAPTEYNLFMCNEIEKLKKEDSKLSGKEKMEVIAKKWKEQKENKSTVKEEEIKEEEVKKDDEIKEEEVKKDDEIKEDKNEVKKEKSSSKKK